MVLRLKRKFGFRKRDLHLGREDDIIFEAVVDVQCWTLWTVFSW